MTLIQALQRISLKGLLFFGSAILCSVSVVLPWQVRIVYMDILGKASKTVLQSNHVTNLVLEHACAEASEKELLLRKE